MKIEKINENQIRCTLTRADLDAREIRLSELAYGSEKAKELFRDMMQQAFQDCGFEANNTPLMIEAIPVSIDSIVLIITKVEDPEELDSRFSRFSPEEADSSGFSSAGAESLTGVDDILDLISRITQARREASAKAQAARKEEETPAASQTVQNAGNGQEISDSDEIFRLSRFYLFRDLETIIRSAKALDPSYDGVNTLYKNPDDGNYYLILRKEDTPADLFNKVCNVLTEYGLQVDYITGIDELFSEHMETILSGNALQTLREL